MFDNFRKSFPKVAINTLIGMNRIVQPNASIQLGILQANMGILPQPKMLALGKQSEVKYSNKVDANYATETGKGEIYIPKTNDFYLGEGEGY